MEEKRKVLVIDDESDFTAMVKLNLEECGRFQVQVENDPHKAFQTALWFLPDLILLDIVMPDIEGPDIAAMFREEPLLQNIPVVYLTATIRRDEARELDEAGGGSVFLAKPCSVDELITAIDAYLH